MVTLLLACGSGDRFWFRNDGADLYVVVEGNLASDDLLLTLHGGPQGSGHDYNTGLAADLLEAELAVVYLDQRGQGGSKGSFTWDDLTIDQMTDDVIGLVRLLHELYGARKRVWLYGHSWGGMLGTATLLETSAQDEVAGWIEADGSHDYPLNDRYTIEMLIAVGEAEIDAGSEWTAEWREVVDRAEEIDPDRVSDEDSLWLNETSFEVEGWLDQVEYGEPWTGFGPLLGWLYARPAPLWTGGFSGRLAGGQVNLEAYETSYTDRLDEIEVPSLFLYGEYDFVTPAQLGRDAHERVSGPAELVLLEHSGHSSMVNEPEPFAEAILGFVEEFR